MKGTASSPATSPSTSSCSSRGRLRAARARDRHLDLPRGLQVGNWNQNQELDVLSQAMYHARELAMTRMEEEADQLGADGIVGVRLDVSRHEWGADLAEFIAVGTAVRHRERRAHRAPTAGRSPATSRAGLLHAALGRLPPARARDGQLRLPRRPPGARRRRRIGRNAEMPNFTQALYDARELAMERMQAEARRSRRGHRRRPADRGKPRLGLARDRVLRDRHGGDADERRAHDPGPELRAQPQRSPPSGLVCGGF